MKRHVIFILIIILFQINILSALEEDDIEAMEEKAPGNERIFFFYFQDDSRIEKYGYLSYILPNSISADLKNIVNYDIRTLPVKMDYLERDASAEERAGFVRMLNYRAGTYDADYFITGAFSVEENKIRIRCQIFDLETQEIIYVDKTESIISAVVLEMIEKITGNINLALNKALEIREQERIRKEEERLANISPFIGFYNMLSGITFGVNYGNADLVKNWGGDFEDTENTSLYLAYDLNNIGLFRNNSVLKNIGIAGRFDYFSTLTEEHKDSRRQELEFTGIGLNISYAVRFTEFFNIAFYGGGGLAEIEIFTEPEYDDMDVLIEPGYQDTDDYPYYNIGASLNFYLKNLRIESGFSYNFVQDGSEFMSYTFLYFGLGYRI